MVAMARALIIGSGPNGLAAAITLAQAEVDVTVVESADRIGGGMRSDELTAPGVISDVCSAVHPFAAASPFFAAQSLADHGLELLQPDIMVAHPLDGGRAASLQRSLDATAESLGADGHTWQRIMDPLVAQFDQLADDALGPVIHIPKHLATFVRFGLQAAVPATLFARRFATPEMQALFAGNAAHIYRPLNRPLTTSAGLMLSAAAHAVGWPVAKGGSEAIATAMASRLAELGGLIECGRTVSTASDTAGFDLVLFDVAPKAVATIGADRLSTSTARALKNWKHGSAAFKLDIAIEGDIPWEAEACTSAGTVHLGGELSEVAETEKQIDRGVMPDRPFVLVGQQYLCDPSRSHNGTNPIWSYAHVPHGYTGDATQAILGQFERFAPGFRERIVAMSAMSVTDIEAYNPNYVGGDIATGMNSVMQLLKRPTLRPYSLGVPGWYLCSAAAPPGAGVHGMCGQLAAERALADLHQ